jgi:pilus assembly protein TadC
MAYIGSIGILLLISILFVISFFGQSRLLEQGERIITKVDNIVTYFEYDSETQITSRVYEVTYTIPLEEGKQKKIKKRIGAKLGQKLQKEDDLPVIYLPQNPSFSLPVEEINPLNRGKLALSGLLTIYLSFIEVWLIEFFWDKGLEDLMNKIDR